MQPEKWLIDNVYGYTNLSHEEKEAIKYFALLWSLFEFQVANRRANAGTILAKCEDLEQQGRLDLASFASAFTHFQTRYWTPQGATQAFGHLNFRKPDRKPLVEAVLAGHSPNDACTLAAYLIIVFRLRNNLFHGEKWQYQIQGQLENFQNANTILMCVMDL